ncbi:MAG: AraC family transcriptional regulator [Clostridia bacterium]|nr:AraC family transcriptional regulator [Clostridia bacterium]
MRYEIFSDSSISPLKINTIGFSRDAEVTKFGPGKRNLYIIHYVTKGKGYFNGVSVNEGQGFFIYPGQDEEYYADPCDPWEFLWVISSDNAMKEIFDRYYTDNDAYVFDFDSVTEVRKIANEIMAKNGDILDSLKMLEMYLHILNSHTYTKISTRCKTNCETYLEFCVDYIETNIHKKITVEELLDLVGVSQPYLYKIFKNKFNMSIKEYITCYKINRAKKLLVETNMLITEIANSVGYSDVLSFSKAFSSKEKVSPQKYRLLTRKNTVILSGTVTSKEDVYHLP